MVSVLGENIVDHHIQDCVAGGALLAEAEAPGSTAEPVFASELGVASDLFFFLRPKRPRRPFLI